MVTPLEALADAIAYMEGDKPGNRAYQNRNPGNLRPTNPAESNDLKGYRVFPTFLQGYAALLTDLGNKCTGHTTTGLKPTSTLAELINVWAPPSDGNDPHAYCAFVVSWIRRATGRNITAQSPLFDIFPSMGQPVQ